MIFVVTIAAYRPLITQTVQLMEIPARGPRPRVNQDALNYGSTSSIHVSSSPASFCSSMSLYSFNSDRDTASFVREAAGRRYNAWQNTPYMLPSDQSEFARQLVGFTFFELADGLIHLAATNNIACYNSRLEDFIQLLTLSRRS